MRRADVIRARPLIDKRHESSSGKGGRAGCGKSVRRGAFTN
jgi:hypothetical protein